MTPQGAPSAGDLIAGIRPMTLVDRERAQRWIGAQKRGSLFLSEFTMVVGFTNMLLPSEGLCVFAGILGMMSFIFGIAVMLNGRKVNKAIQEGTVTEIMGVCMDVPGRNGAVMVGPVLIPFARKSSAALVPGRTVTVGIIPKMKVAVSFDGIPIKDPMPIELPRNYEDVMRDRTYSWPAPEARPAAPAAARAAPAAKFCPRHGCKVKDMNGAPFCPECNAAVEVFPKYCPYHGVRTDLTSGGAWCPECEEVIPIL